jgi:hypothetical protein
VIGHLAGLLALFRFLTGREVGIGGGESTADQFRNRQALLEGAAAQPLMRTRRRTFFSSGSGGSFGMVRAPLGLSYHNAIAQRRLRVDGMTR